jgi:hypothetical protein
MIYDVTRIRAGFVENVGMFKPTPEYPRGWGILM